MAGATAAPGGDKGKPESKPQATEETGSSTHGNQGNSGHAYGQQKTNAPPEPEQTESAPPAEANTTPAKPGPQGQSVQQKQQQDAPQPKGNAKAPPPSTKAPSSGVQKSTGAGPKTPQNAGTGDNPQGRGPSGKTRYCHATHSETNPYVSIETNNNGLPAHRAHQDEEDIIPESGDCPGGTTRGNSRGGSNGVQNGNGNGHGPGGKATYCHSTRSATNPFVTITTSVNALAAHVRHHAGDDIIPPETGDCGDSQNANGNGQSKAGGPDGKVTFCHSTRSSTNPFVTITTSVNALAAHVRHHAGDDIVPAVNGECPGPAPTQQVDDNGTGKTPAPNTNQRAVTPEAPGGPEGQAPAENDRPAGPDDVAGSDPGGSGDDEPAEERVAGQRDGRGGPGESDVLAENEVGAGGPGDADAAPELAEETAADAGGKDDDSLPFTGLGVLAILAAALLALGGGLAARRASRAQD